MKKIFLLILAMFYLHADSESKSSSEIKVQRLEKYMYILDIDTDNQDFITKITDIISRTINDENPACRGFVVKTEKGIFRFEKCSLMKCKGKKKGKDKKFKMLTAEMIAMKEMHGGCERSLRKVGMLLDKEMFKKHIKRIKHKKDDD